MFKSVVSRRSTFVTARRVANVSSSNKSLPRFFTSDAAATEATETPTPSLTNTQAKKHNSKILMFVEFDRVFKKRKNVIFFFYIFSFLHFK